MQYLVAAWFCVQALLLASLPFWYIRTMTQWADAMNQQNLQLDPGSPAPPPDLMANLNNEMTVAFYVVVAVFFAVAVAAMVVALRRWLWGFFVILGLLCLETLYFGLGVVSTLVTSFATSKLLGQSVGPPDWMIWGEVGFAIPSAALVAWMLMAAFRRGPWAMKNVTTGGHAAGREIMTA